MKLNIKKLIKENRSLFEALEEMDRIGKLRKVSYKERISLTIDEKLMMDFRRYCRENGYSMSKKVESMIKKEVKTD